MVNIARGARLHQRACFNREEITSNGGVGTGVSVNEIGEASEFAADMTDSLSAYRRTATSVRNGDVAKAPGPSVRRRQLGAALRQLRKDSGTSREDAAGWLEITVQTLSKVELGRQAIKSPNVRLLCQLYDIDASTTDTLLRLAKEANQRGWWASYRDTVPEWFRQFVSFEGDASELWEYQAEFVPGLLQTSEYAKAITRASRPNVTDAELARSVELRRQRQEQLDGDHPPHLHLYLNEAVVRRAVGSPEVMHEQLDYLMTASKLDHVSLRIVPFSAGAYAAMAGSFVLIHFPEEDEPAFAYLENDRGALYQEDPGDIARYSVMVDQLAERGLSEADTRVMLDEVARSL